MHAADASPPRAARAWLFVLVLGSCAYFVQGAGANQNSRFDLVRAIVEEHGLAIDTWGANTFDKSAHGGRLWSDKAPGLSLLAVPPYAAGVRALQPADALEPSPVALHLLTLCTVALATAFASVALLATLADLGVALPVALLAVVGWTLGTNAFGYAGLFVAHQLVGALLALSFAALRAARAARPGLALAAGVAAGVAVLSEFPSALAVAALLGYAWATLGVRGAARFVAGGVPSALVLFAYNAACFGGPLSFGYENVAQAHFHAEMAHGLFGIEAPSPSNTLALTFGEFRGLFPLAPFLLLAIPGAIVAIRRRALRAEGVVAAVAFVATLAAMSGYRVWNGGAAMGPRHLVGVLPFATTLAAIGMDALARRAGRAGVAIAAALVAASVAICTATVAVMPELPEVQLTVPPADGMAIPRLEHPLRDFVAPLFARGELGIKATAKGAIGFSTRSRGHDGDAFALGEALGLRGLASLVPLVAFWVACGAGLARSVRGARATNDESRRETAPAP